MTTCQCGVRIARGRYLRWVHVARPDHIAPHYAVPSRSAVPDGPLPSRGPLTRTARRPAPERVPGKRSGSR